MYVPVYSTLMYAGAIPPLSRYIFLVCATVPVSLWDIYSRKRKNEKSWRFFLHHRRHFVKGSALLVRTVAKKEKINGIKNGLSVAKRIATPTRNAVRWGLLEGSRVHSLLTAAYEWSLLSGNLLLLLVYWILGYENVKPEMWLLLFIMDGVTPLRTYSFPI